MKLTSNTDRILHMNFLLEGRVFQRPSRRRGWDHCVGFRSALPDVRLFLVTR